MASLCARCKNVILELILILGDVLVLIQKKLSFEVLTILYNFNTLSTNTILYNF